MGKIIIYGAGIEGEECISHCKELGIEINAVVDTFKNGYCAGMEIQRPDIINKGDTIVISAQYQVPALSIYYSIKERDLDNNIYWWHKAKCFSGMDFFDDECNEISSWGKIVMPHIEFHIVDNCNLNCRGCSHFSPLFSNTTESFEKKLQNVDFLLEKFSTIARLDILGGGAFDV